MGVCVRKYRSVIFIAEHFVCFLIRQKPITEDLTVQRLHTGSILKIRNGIHRSFLNNSPQLIAVFFSEGKIERHGKRSLLHDLTRHCLGFIFFVFHMPLGKSDVTGSVANEQI